MNLYTVVLSPVGKPAFDIEVTEMSSRRLPIENIIEKIENAPCVFSDLCYSIQIVGPEVSKVKNVFVYINDSYEQSTFADGYIRFNSYNGREKRIFLDCYGFVELCFTIQYFDGTELTLRSDYLPVLVKKGVLNESVKSMANYVYNNIQELLYNGEFKPKSISGLGDSDFRNLESNIILAEEIVSIYEMSYGYFKANCRFKVQKIDVIDRVEKLQFISAKTIQYTAQHPEFLKPVGGFDGVKIQNRSYLPEKTMTSQNIYSKDIIENRIIVGFLKHMVFSIQTLISEINRIIAKIPKEETLRSDYVYSSVYIFMGTYKYLYDAEKRLDSILKKTENLWTEYSHMMQIQTECVEYMPEPTFIFLSVSQYNKIYRKIYQWFKYGIYDFSKEVYMLSFIKISTLYENYVLAKLICYFKSRGYLLDEVKKCNYPVSDRWKYRNTYCNNTFIYSGTECKITIYYQPVVYDSDKSFINGIGVYRNNTISINEDSEGERNGHYYVPDFLIKLERNGVSRYICGDAKFSTATNIKQYYLYKLVYKYLFSLSPISVDSVITGLCIIYGQCQEEEKLKTIYDKQLDNQLILPFAEILPLIEINQDEHHFEQIDRIIYLALQRSKSGDR